MRLVERSTRRFKVTDVGEEVYRHARATCVDIRLTWRPQSGLFLLVADDGVGTQSGGGFAVTGVGLAGMRGRVEDLGGRLRVRQMACGMVVAAHLPRRRARRA